MKQRINHPFLLMGILIAINLSSCQFNVQDETSNSSITILEEIEVDSVVADFPVAFKFLSHQEWQFVAYYNKDRMLSVASRKTNDTQWSYQTLASKVGWDSHNRITMAIDRNNCLHLSGNMHNDTLVYFKTSRPLDISSFQRVLPMVALKDELSCTYPNFIKTGKGDLIYTYRKGGSGNGVNLTNSYNASSKSFQRLSDQALFDGLGLMSAYANGPTLGPDSLFHTIWFWRNTPACETNHDLSYARTPDLIHWETADGSPLDLPINPNAKQSIVDPIPPGGGAINGGARLFFDDSKQPLIAYMKYDSMGNSQIFLARFTNNKWVSKQISNWDYRWAFSGPGSIEFEIKLTQGFIRSDKKIIIPYYHIKRGFGQLVVDEKTLSGLEDNKVDKPTEENYPAALLIPNSGIDSVSVRWLRENQHKPQQYYALRWETMGKRRFYQAPNQPIKGSSMKMYLFQKNN